jgi:NADP-dependent aldehyde dehydrogenase
MTAGGTFVAEAEPGGFADASGEAVAAACAAAAGAVAALREDARRSALLRAIARRVRADAGELHAAAAAETELPRLRLETELLRTCVQLERFADVVDEGSHVHAILDSADPAAPVAPRPDIRRMLVPIGPVCVFEAGNFPYAFGVAGGDTASALAAGCPVIVKAHPSHPRTAARFAALIAEALAETGLPGGVFTLLHGVAHDVGAALVRASQIAAVAFTGSLAGGRAMLDLAAARATPIPVFAEMSSTNPVFITAGALRARGTTLAAELAASVANASGQLCTKPGLVFVPAGRDGDAFIADVAERLDAVDEAPMLNLRTHGALRAALDTLEAHGARRLTAPRSPERGGAWQAPGAHRHGGGRRDDAGAARGVLRTVGADVAVRRRRRGAGSRPHPRGPADGDDPCRAG